VDFPDWQALIDTATIGVDEMPEIVLTLPADSALALLHQLQLALRQPGNTGPSSVLVRQIAKTIEKEMTREADSDDLRKLLALGWAGDRPRD
jgi:hypothetical protein